MVLPELQKFLNIGMPGLEVNSERALSLTSTLVAVPGSIVEDTEHRYETVGMAVRSSDVASRGSNVVNGEADSSGTF